MRAGDWGQNKSKSREINFNFKENKNSFETLFQPTWYEIKTWSYLELITSAERVKCSSYFLASNQNKRVAI